MRLITLLLAAVVLCGCSAFGSSDGTGLALTVHEPITFHRETKPDPLRVVSGYSAPSWQAPQPSSYVAPAAPPGWFAPSWQAPAAAPCQ